MLIKTRGIVIRTMKFKESGLICDIYTEELGLRSYIVSGVYNKKGKSKAAYFHPLSQLCLVVYERENKDLNRLKEYELDKVFQQIPFDFIKGTLALFLTEILRNTLKEKTPNATLFDFLDTWIEYLEQLPEQHLAHFPLYFLIEMSDLLGFGQTGDFEEDGLYFDLREGVFVTFPPIHQDYMDQEQSEYYKKVLKARENLGNMPLTRSQRMILLEKLLQYYKLHTDHFKDIKSAEIISRVLR